MEELEKYSDCSEMPLIVSYRKLHAYTQSLDPRYLLHVPRRALPKGAMTRSPFNRISRAAYESDVRKFTARSSGPELKYRALDDVFSITSFVTLYSTAYVKNLSQNNKI